MKKQTKLAIFAIAAIALGLYFYDTHNQSLRGCYVTYEVRYSTWAPERDEVMTQGDCHRLKIHKYKDGTQSFKDNRGAWNAQKQRGNIVILNMLPIPPHQYRAYREQMRNLYN